MENVPKLLFVERVYLLRSREHTHKLRFVSVDMEGEVQSNEELCSSTVIIPGRKHAVCEWIVCSGLICILIDRRIYLCNPAIHQVCELPRCSPSAFSLDNLVAFGYLRSKKEYKVVHFFYSDASFCFREIQFAELKCEVLTLNEVSGISNGWKEIAEMTPYHPDSSGLLVNECMYWFAKFHPCGRSTDRIIAFDFENEKFLTIYRPSCFESVSGLKMIDLKGMLCLPDTRRFPQSSILDLWILEDKISSTWVKEYSIDLDNFGLQDVKPFFRTLNEEIIFRHLDKLVFFDLKGNRVRRVIKCVEDSFWIYSESLFSLGSSASYIRYMIKDSFCYC
ncbi:hypothetical protein P3S67_002475 [Capsicum chacoense]